MTSSVERSTWGLRWIGALKLATALALGTAGFGILRLLDQDLAELVESFVSRLHLDPDSRLVHAVITQVGGIDRHQLEALGVGTLFYGLLESVEGVGLLLRRRWAEYLTVLATVLLLPLEVYELAHKRDWLRVVVLLANLAILVYLIVKLRQGNDVQPRNRGESTSAGERPLDQAVNLAQDHLG